MRLKDSIWILALLPVLTAALGPTYFISAPNVIRVGVDETIVINVFGDLKAAGAVPVTVTLTDFPARTTQYCSVTVNVEKNVPQTVTLQVRPEDVVANNDPDEPPYVYIHTSSASPAIQIDDGAKVLLSYKAGFTFIQTDKPIYTPRQTVFIRLVSVDQQMRPSNDQVQIDILTPQGVIVRRFKDIQPEDGFVSVDYTFPTAPAFGEWTVVASYGHEKKHNTSVQFVVKEYVLPTYSVEITLSQKYIKSSDAEITTLVSGRYVFGENVHGFYRVKYSLLNEDGSLQLIKDVNDNDALNEHAQGSDALTMAEILNGQDFNNFIGKRLHIEAFVIEQATGKVESSNNTVLQFVDSPFIFKWDQTLKYFKTHLPFEVKTVVHYCYGDPVPETDVRVRAIAHMADGSTRVLQSEDDLKTTSPMGHVYFTLNVPLNTERIVVTMTTVAGGDLANFERTDTFEIHKFNTEGNSQLLIRPIAEDVLNVKQNIPVDLQRNAANNENVDVIFSYIVAGGKILQPQAITEVIVTTVTNIEVNQDMVPSARMVAFYVNDANKVIADSLWIDVEDVCENPVEITVPPNDNGRTYYEPGSTVQLTLTGKKQTKVAMLAVDEAVYLLQDYHRLTKKKVFARMASYDLGCGPGGGRDTSDTFKNAGISVITNADLDIASRQDLSCDEHNRRRRAVAGVGLNVADIEALYSGNETIKQYCTRGAQLSSGNFTCEKRLARLTNPNKASYEGFDSNHLYMQVFFNCCIAATQASGRSGGPALPPPKVDFTDVQIRSDFRESWLFKDPLISFGDQESVVHPIALPHSITTWVIQAVGVSPLHGMCVADNKNIVTRRQYFLDVAVPYSVMRKEQVAIVATVYNYADRDQRMRINLQMEGIDGLCSNARPGEFQIQEGEVEGGKAKSFLFVVIPLEVKDFEFTIYMFTNLGNDAVRKTLHVVPEGTPQVQPLSIILDPAGIGQDVPADQMNKQVDHGQDHNIEHIQFNDQAERNQRDTVKLAIPDDAVPNTAQCEVSVIGSLLGPVADVVIQGLGNEKFLQTPTGCGEQTMIRMAPNVYIFKYLKETGQDTPEIEQKAIDNMNDGYSREVNNYRSADGAFKTWAHLPGNSWLTAFVLRVFCQASEFTFIDPNVVCGSMQWLTSAQDPDGSFRFTHRTYHGSHFMGGVNEPIPLTAFVLVALSECSCDKQDINHAVTQAVSQGTLFLEGKLAEINQDPHTLAIATYALALVNSGKAVEFNTALKQLKQDGLAGAGTAYLGTEPRGPLTVETTAYAILAQIHLGEVSSAYPMVLWLLMQRDQIGNWYSTQDTMVSLQALSEYSQQAATGDIDLTCGITASDDAAYDVDWTIMPANALVLQAAVAPVEGELIFDTTGIGLATLSINLHYYKATGDADTCPFEVEVTPRDEKPQAPLPGGIDVKAKPKKKISITVCARFTGAGKTNMAIIDVGLLSGFSPIKDSLVKAQENVALVQDYEVADRSVIFYMDEIPGVEKVCIVFEALQDFVVGNVQPVPVKVYDYYLPEKKCTKFYRPDGRSAVLDTICQGDACECAAASCLNMDPEVRTNPVALKNMACETVQHFAYKATYVSTEPKDTFDTFLMEVAPLKKGSDQNVELGQNRQFWKSANCDHPIVEEGNDYLIVGRGGLPLKDANGVVNEYRHFVDSKFTVIHWPREEQYRAVETDCKNACPKDSDNRNCKVRCRNEHRPAENAMRQYFQKVEQEFMLGCPL